MQNRMLRNFMRHVENSEAEGCWAWKGAKMNSGYGNFWLNRKIMGAHRAAYILHIGAIEEGNVVMHTCDNKLCVNPAHLRQASQQENMDDMFRKGRASINEKHYACKITDAQVIRIREDKRTHQAIADEYGVSRPQVTKIKLKQSRGRL